MRATNVQLRFLLVHCPCHLKGWHPSLLRLLISLPARLPCCVLQGRGCGVWQHCDCLGLAAPPAKFLCELCRCVGRK